MSQKIKVIIADDHPMFLDGVVNSLKNNSEVEVVAHAYNGKQVLELLKETSCDVLITDLDMPILNGQELIKELEKLKLELKIIVLSMHMEGHVIAPLLKNGIKGYLYKDSEQEVILEAIRTVHNGDTYYPSKVQESIMKDLMRPKSAQEGDQLSEREVEVLKLIAEECTQDEIAEKLFISPHTVVFHKRKLMLKMDVKNVAGLIRKAAKQGLLD